MANPYYEENGKTYLECKECHESKELSLFYKHNEGFLGVMGRCRDCIKSGRKIEKELFMARKRDKDRYRNNPKRREYVFNQTRNLRKEKGYGPIHTKCSRSIKKLGIRPTVCPLCKIESDRIEAHHYDYSKPLEIIFCCSICHSKLDMKKIDHRDCKIVDLKEFGITYNPKNSPF